MGAATSTDTADGGKCACCTASVSPGIVGAAKIEDETTGTQPDFHDAGSPGAPLKEDSAKPFQEDIVQEPPAEKKSPEPDPAEDAKPLPVEEVVKNADPPAEQAAAPAETQPDDKKDESSSFITGKRREVTVSVTAASSEQLLGLDVHYDKGALRISMVKPGMVEDWNKNNANVLKVRGGDRIVSVNGVSGTSEEFTAELKKSKSSSNFVLVVQRPDELQILVEKGSAEQPIGIDIDRPTLRVLKVADGGPVMAYNKSLDASNRDFEIRVGDQVIEVNGVSFDESKVVREGPGIVSKEVAALIEELKTKKTLRMIVRRPLPA